MRKFALLVLLTLFSLTAAKSQGDFPDSQGKDFWLTFMPNYHNYNGGNSFRDSLFIFIGATAPTKGTITFLQDGSKIDFDITDPSKMLITGYYFFGKELTGYGYVDGQNWDNERISRKTFHITSDNDITVYAHLKANYTNEACMVLPTDALGYQHYIMSYNSHLILDEWNGGIAGGTTPSQFTITATEDNTKVDIDPTTPTTKSTGSFSVTLNKGDTYLVQAYIDEFLYDSDLTGTYVRADKPIAVFSGHQRAAIPRNGDDNEFFSRDCIIEQMPPTSSWGMNAFLLPFPQPDPSVVDASFYSYNDLYRIIASNDNTTITFNGINPITLNAGEFIEGDLTEPISISADKSILAGVYKRSSNVVQGTNNPSDPSLVIIPPKEQFNNFYRFLNVQVAEVVQGGSGVITKAFPYQYAMIVAPNAGLSTIQLDGKLLQASIFTPIPSSTYSYAIISKMADGVHTLQSDLPVGLYVFGYGYANSYGYFGGMKMKPFDNAPPKITAATNCYTVTGSFSETSEYDTYIEKFESPGSKNINAKVESDTIKPRTKIVNFRISLVDKYQDGHAEVVATDSAGWSATGVYDIPGFTLRAVNTTGAKVINERKGLKGNICFDIEIENYGKFEHKLYKPEFRSKSGNFILTSNADITLAAGAKRTITVCLSAAQAGTYKDTLYLYDDCGERNVAFITIEAGADSDKPKTTIAEDPCFDKVDIVALDTNIFDYGIEKVEILKSQNCVINKQELTPKRAYYKVDVNDPYQEAVYAIQFTDSAGNVSLVTDTIPGFTLKFDAINLVNFGEQQLGTLACDSVKIINYGNFDIKLSEIRMRYNVFASIPPAQLPLLIKAHDTAYIEVCMKPLVYDKKLIFDTIYIDYHCISKNLPVEAEPIPLSLTSTSPCNTVITMRSRQVSKYFELDVFPNPTEGIVTVEFSNPNEGPVTIGLYDAYGRYAGELLKTETMPGVYQVNIDVSSYQNGVYLLNVKGKNESVVKKLIIKK